MSLRIAVERHEFTAGNGFDGWCRVHVYDGTDASGGLPVVIISEPIENDGPSVTNTIEQLAAEALTRYVAAQDGAEPPFVLVEHYYDRQPHRGRGALHDPFFGETFDLVTFKSWRRRQRWVRRDGGVRWYQTFETPDWRRSDRETIEQMIGEALPWAACTCQRKTAGVEP